MHLLTTNQAKMNKAVGTGYRSAILHLQPAWSYKKIQTCSGLHGVCASCCIAQTGHGRFSQAQEARKRRTKLFVDDPRTFYALLDADLLSHGRSADKHGEIATCRLNGTSDLPWELYGREYGFGVIGRTGKDLFDSHPATVFYDYTKSAQRVLKQEIANYHLTYSASERSTIDEIRAVLKAGYNVAMVFGVRRGEELPTRYKINGKWFDVINGDADDLRIPQRDGRGNVIGLRYKLAFSAKTGKAVKPPPGFVFAADAPLTLATRKTFTDRLLIDEAISHA